MGEAGFDLVLQGGRVIDPAQELDTVCDVGFVGDRVAAVGPNLAAGAKQVVNVAGHIVTPGLIDLHTHIYWGATSLSVQPDPLLYRSGVTTMVDTGSAGAGNFHGFKAFIMEQARTRVLAFLNISYAGIFGVSTDLAPFGAGELADETLLHPASAVRVARAHPDRIVGMKVRASASVGDATTRPVQLALVAADRIGKPLMVHTGKPTPMTTEILPLLRPGDILTHCFRGFPNSIVNAQGRPFPEVVDARQRGVIFDIGHGSGSFSWETARAALDAGILPDVISTDIHTQNLNGPVFDLPTTMTKFLALGMALPDIVRRTTLNAAQAIGWADRLGHLQPGACGDATVLTLADEPVTLVDTHGEKVAYARALRHIGTVVGGAYVPHRAA